MTCQRAVGGQGARASQYMPSMAATVDENRPNEEHAAMDGSVVAGVDVGGPGKGFHAVLFRDGALDRDGIHHSLSANEIARWCRERGASLIGVDAPCRWRAKEAEPRLAEREMRREGIYCFLTPTEARAKELHRSAPAGSGFYDWMLNGSELFRRLERSHALFGGRWNVSDDPICFETFPHAIARVLSGSAASAREKRAARRKVLSNAGVDVSRLPNLDYLDAALCALAATYLAIGSFKSYGDLDGGLIVVPKPRS